MALIDRNKLTKITDDDINGWAHKITRYVRDLSSHRLFKEIKTYMFVEEPEKGTDRSFFGVRIFVKWIDDETSWSELWVSDYALPKDAIEGIKSLVRASLY